MAKKSPPTGKTKPAPGGNFSAAKATAPAAARPAPEVVKPAPEAVEEQPPPPAAKPVPAAPRAKRERYVRGAKEERAAAAAPLPERSRSAAGKLMSKGMMLPPKEKVVAGTKDAKGPR